MGAGRGVGPGCKEVEDGVSHQGMLLQLACTNAVVDVAVDLLVEGGLHGPFL